jgi:hypothetical protein
VTPHERLERGTWDLFWVPEGVTIIDRPELLALHAPRPLPYLNAVYRTRAAAERLPALIGEVVALHQGFVSRWVVADTVETGALEREIAAAGYAATTDYDARVVAVDAFTSRPTGDAIVRRVTDEDSLRDCWSVNESAFARDGNFTDEDLEMELAQCAPADSRIQRFVAYLADEPVSSGGINLYPDLGIGFLWAGGTVPSARGRGAYSAVVAARIACAAARGIGFVGLYAQTDTSSPIVAAQGFGNVGHMTYWERGRP